MPTVSLIGGAYEARSLIAAAQRAVNLYAEPMPEAQGEPGRAAHYPTPGLRQLNTIGTGPIRGIRRATTGALFVVSGNGVYVVDTKTWAPTHLGDITYGLRTPVSMADNGLDMVIVDGTSGGWHVTLAGNAFAAISDPGGMFSGADRVDFLDTYLLFNKPNTPQFYSSDSLALTFDPLWFANKEAYSDLLRTLVVVKRDIWLLGEMTTEIWADVGKEDFPFESQPDVFIDHGIAAKYSVANYDNALFWLCNDRQGHGFVIQGAGYQTKRISTYAIEAEIARYPRIDDAIGFTYLLAGHAFYVIAFPAADKTWSYDITTGHWHEWVWIDANGAEHRHRANCCWPVDGMPIVGDWQNGNIYALDLGVFTDLGKPIKRVRSFPHGLNEGKRVFYTQFLADMETGNSPPVTVTTTTSNVIIWPPQIAQMTGASVGSTNTPVGTTLVDWARGLTYLVGQTGYQKYTTEMVTRGPLVTVATPTRFVLGADIDPLSGDLIMQTVTTLAYPMPISKIDPNTFAVLATFGGAGSTYPTAVAEGDDLACVVCNGVTFAFLKYGLLSGQVAGIRVDTMAHCGFIAAVVSGATDNRGFIIRGKSGGTTASVFLSWNTMTAPRSAVPLYRIDLTSAATSYNPATWPATNPGITWTTVGTVSVASVDPAWTGFTVYSLGYDLADGNVLMLCGTASATDGYRLLKVNATTAAVMWNLTMGVVEVDLGASRIDGSLWLFRNVGSSAGPTDSYRIDTINGTMTTQPISGVYAGANSGMMKVDSETSVMVYGGDFARGPGVRPVPVTGTSDFTTSWATMGGQTTTTIVTSDVGLETNKISLRWSDDRGHSWSSPVVQDIGEMGEYKTSLQWNRLGMCRDRVFELSWSVPMPTALQGAWITLTPGGS